MSNFDPKGFKYVGDYLSSSSDKTTPEMGNNLGLPPRDAINRTIVGRYYYSAFLQLREVLKAELNNYPSSLKNNDFKDFLSALDERESHKAVALFLEKLKEKIDDFKLRQAHNSILYLRALRNAADYDLSNQTKIRIVKNHETKEESVDFSKKAYVVKSLRKYELIEQLLDDCTGETLEDILKVQKNTVIKCIEETIRNL